MHRHSARHAAARTSFLLVVVDCLMWLLSTVCRRKAGRHAAGSNSFHDAGLAVLWYDDDTEVQDSVDSVPVLSAVRDFSIVAIAPAHNEQECLESTILSLIGQTRRPGTIIIVSDNSTDYTPFIARKYRHEGVVLLRTINNDAKKAGALNAGIKYLSGSDGFIRTDIEYVLTMDGDTYLAPDFVEKACRILDRTPRMGGVSAACRGRARENKVGPFRRWLMAMQRIEYDRTASMRSMSYVHTMSGAGSMYRSIALNDLLADRQVFDTRPDNLVEDYETTVELKTRGWHVGVNEFLVAYTDLMPSLPMLLRQRERWVRGTIDELRRRGWTRATWFSKLQILCGSLVIPISYVMMASLIYAIVATGGVKVQWFVVPLFVASFQVWAVRHLGLKYMMLEATLLPEILYGIARHYWFVRASIQSRFSRTHSWA